MPAEPQATASGSPSRMFTPAFWRQIGLVLALVLLCVVGVLSADERFASINNVLTILRLASVIGVVSIGMTFVITGGGIDLSVRGDRRPLLGDGVDGRGQHSGPTTTTGSGWWRWQSPSGPLAAS